VPLPAPSGSYCGKYRPPVNAQVFHLGIHIFSGVRVPSLAAVEEGHGQKHGDMSVRSARPLQQRSASPFP
jgi:hypothetical protein